MQRRLNDVALPLLIAASDSCPFERGSTYGFLLKDEANPDNSKEMRALGLRKALLSPMSTLSWLLRQQVLPLEIGSCKSM